MHYNLTSDPSRKSSKFSKVQVACKSVPMRQTWAPSIFFGWSLPFPSYPQKFFPPHLTSSPKKLGGNFFPSPFPSPFLPLMQDPCFFGWKLATHLYLGNFQDEALCILGELAMQLHVLDLSIIVCLARAMRAPAKNCNHFLEGVFGR